ncbi:hypothetical protein CNR22_16715 [Sphingobacteriaceae bacterium]|nr:hypothetical protein CNR22_16715 [Sphingobacteriaceae bacterium]
MRAKMFKKLDMKINLNKLIVVLLLLLASKQSLLSQTLSAIVQPTTACPNQTAVVTAVWPNASNPSYSLYTPGFPPPNAPFAVSFTTNTFVISNPGPLPAYDYTIVGIATVGGNTVTQTFPFQFYIQSPPPMTFTNPTSFCNGTAIQFTAQPGANTYSFSGPGVASSSSITNVITILNSVPNNTGNFTVTAVIAGCTVTGVTNVQVSPYKTLAVTPVVNVCQGDAATFTAGLTGGTQDYTWKDNTGNVIASGPGLTSINILNTTINNQGVYTVMTDDLFNSTLLCPYTATAQLNVVQTSTLALTANPGTMVCQGTNLGLLANAALNPSFQWTGPSFSSNLINPTINPALPANAGVYSVTATFQGAFISCPVNAVIQIVVIPVSTPMITMPNIVCQGGTIQATASSAVNPVEWAWTGPLFASVPVTNAVSITVPSVPANASGTQYLTAYFAANQQCPVTSSVQLNVVPVTTISVVPPDVVCAPNQVFLQALATGAYNYQWSGPNSYVNQGPNVFVYTTTSPLSANGIYTVIAYFGGTALVCTSVNTVQVQVNVPLTFSLIPRQHVCYNSSVTITGPAGATSYSWTSSTGFNSANKDINFPSVQPINSGNYTLNIMNGPCPSSAFTELVVLDEVKWELKPFDRTICRGDTIFLEGAARGGSENYAYTWNPAVYLESSTGPKQMAVPLGSVLYNLTVYDIACPAYKIAHAFNVKVNQPPLPNLQLTQSEGCVPLCLDIDPKLGKTSAITTYDFGGRRIFQRNDSLSFKYCLDEAGTYTLNIYTKGVNGCSNSYTYPFPLIVNPKPGSDITWEPEIPTTNDVITFNPTFKSDWPITYMSWTFLGGVTEGDTNMLNLPGVSDTTNVKNPTRAYSQIGMYPVVLIAKNDRECTDTILKLVKITDDMQIFVPNSFTPNDDGINDVFIPKGTGMKSEGYTMDIFNRAGLNIFTTKDITQGWDGKVGGQFVKDHTYIYKIKVVGMNGEGRREFTGYVTLIK